MKRFTQRNDLKGLLQSVGFLLFFVVTGGRYTKLARVA
jgi:hypothetical protein